MSIASTRSGSRVFRVTHLSGTRFRGWASQASNFVFLWRLFDRFRSRGSLLQSRQNRARSKSGTSKSSVSACQLSLILDWPARGD